MFGLCLDKQLGSGEPVRGEAADELIGKPYGNKGQGVSSVGRRVEHPANREVRWRVPESERSLVESPGKPVGKASFGTKSGQHRTLVQLGEAHPTCGSRAAGARRRAWAGREPPPRSDRATPASHREARSCLRVRRAVQQRDRRLSPPGTVAQGLQCRPRRRRPRRPQPRRYRPARRVKPPHRSNGREPGQVGHRPRAW